MIHRLLFPLVTCGLLLGTTPQCPAQTDDRVSSALAAAEAWVHQIDAGQYEESYAAAGNALHDKQLEDKWVLILKTFRTPYGEVVSRKEISHVDKPNGFEGADGEFMVITYDTSFQKLDAAVEVIVLKREGGRWRGAGYNVAAKPSPQTDQAPLPPMPQTETTTITTNKPPQ